VIRDAQRSDAEAIAGIGSVAFALAYRDMLSPETIAAVVDQTYSPAAVAHSIEWCQNVTGAHFTVAEHEGVVTGFLHFDSEGREPELHRIYTDPNRTGRGIGRALMQDLHARLAPGATYILMVLAANVGAIRFYERCGLVSEREVDAVQHYRDNMGFLAPETTEVPAVIMRYRS
jgi:ribosomal protein S18 acetylase RimI-like enzyme